MKKYWSCTKFADWLRGTPKPSAGTLEQWDTWHETAKKIGFRYWLAEEGLDYLQDFIFWPANRLNDLCFYINNRWFAKRHTLTSTLKRGAWHEFDTRLLHAAFDELVNFVEIECAWMHGVKTPWYRTVFRIGLWRCPEAGIAHLDWASSLKHNEDWIDKNDPSYGQPTQQALAAIETLTLYKWWKEEYPRRPDPHDVSGWSKYCEDNPTPLQFKKDNAKAELVHTILDKCSEIEKEYEQEDTAMLIRLVKIRQSLWT